MKTDSEVHLMLRERKNGKTLEQAAARAGMSVPTARKYLRAAKLPSALKAPRTYRTHPNPFELDWPWVEQQLQRDPALQAKTLFGLLCEEHPDRYSSGQLRTFQRHVARWRALHGPEREVIFEQVHVPGRLAQSIEAGGHVRGQIGSLALLDQVLGAVDVPVLAGGGIGSGRRLAAVLAAGARVGTRFVAAAETEAHPSYVQALTAAEAKDTIYTEAFSASWRGPHRVLRACVEAAEAYQGEFVGESVDPYTSEHSVIQRFQPLAVHTGVTGAIAAMPHWAGESVDGVKAVLPAAEIVRELVDEAEQILRRWS